MRQSSVQLSAQCKQSDEHAPMIALDCMFILMPERTETEQPQMVGLARAISVNVNWTRSLFLKHIHCSGVNALLLRWRQ